MIKTEQAWQRAPEIGGHSGHGQQGARLVSNKASDMIVSAELRAGRWSWDQSLSAGHVRRSGNCLVA
jgi:hypothetical protein